jgi:hypothetical protein
MVNARQWLCGATDNASDYGSEDCRFESCQSQKQTASFVEAVFFHLTIEKRYAPPGGLEPPTFRLTAERAANCATEADAAGETVTVEHYQLCPVSRIRPPTKRHQL